jgi:hypothetical protein
MLKTTGNHAISLFYLVMYLEANQGVLSLLLEYYKHNKRSPLVHVYTEQFAVLVAGIADIMQNIHLPPLLYKKIVQNNKAFHELYQLTWDCEDSEGQTIPMRSAIATLTTSLIRLRGTLNRVYTFHEEESKAWENVLDKGTVQSHSISSSSSLSFTSSYLSSSSEVVTALTFTSSSSSSSSYRQTFMVLQGKDILINQYHIECTVISPLCSGSMVRIKKGSIFHGEEEQWTSLELVCSVVDLRGCRHTWPNLYTFAQIHPEHRDNFIVFSAGADNELKVSSEVRA